MYLLLESDKVYDVSDDEDPDNIPAVSVEPKAPVPLNDDSCHDPKNEKNDNED